MCVVIVVVVFEVSNLLKWCWLSSWCSMLYRWGAMRRRLLLDFSWSTMYHRFMCYFYWSARLVMLLS